jgi:hypothetical protein
MSATGERPAAAEFVRRVTPVVEGTHGLRDLRLGERSLQSRMMINGDLDWGQVWLVFGLVE